MKRLFLLLTSLFVFPFFSSSQSYLSWSNEIIVAEDSLYGSTRPRIGLTNNGPVITWGGGSTVQVWSSRWNGAGFDAPLAISPIGIDPYVNYWTSAEMATSGDTVFVVYQAQPIFTGPVYLVRSTDGGITYTDTLRVDNVGTDEAFLPTVGIGSGGNPAVAFMKIDQGGGNPRWVVSNSLDGGATFNPDVSASAISGTEVCDCCPATVLPEGQRQTMLFRNNDNNIRDIWIGISNDGGASFPAGADIDPNNWYITACPATGPDGVISGDSIRSVWLSGGGGPSRIWANSTNLNTIQSAGAIMVADNVPGNLYQRNPRIAGGNDTIGIAWDNTYFGDKNCVLMYSTTGLQGLTTEFDTINDSIPGTQLNPDIAYADGVFHLVWTDEMNKRVMYRTASVFAVGIEELRNNTISGVLVKPNPFSEATTLEFNAPLANVEIYDLLQRRVRAYEQVTGGKVIIERGALLPGMYFFAIRSTSGIASGKLVVQ